MQDSCEYDSISRWHINFQVSAALRILQLINSLDPRQGGTVECVRQIGTSLRGEGHCVEVVVCGDPPDRNWLNSFPLKVHALGPGYGKYAYTPRLKKWLLDHGREYDAWIINGLWHYQGLSASRMAASLGIPYFVYAHGMLDPWSRRATPVKYIKKLLYWIFFERQTARNANAVVFTTPDEAVLARRYFPMWSWRELVVGNGIAEPPPRPQDAAAAFRSNLSIPGERRIVLFLSRIHPKKGIDLLLHAFADSSVLRQDCQLVIAGDGERAHVDEVHALARRLGLDQSVSLPGALYGHSKWQAFYACDVFALPSHQENFGIAVVEAMAAGAPIITTTAVNIHSTVDAYGAGIICRDDKDDVRTALERWHGLDMNALTSMRRNARRCYEEQYRIDVASHKLLSAMQTAIDRNEAAVERS